VVCELLIEKPRKAYTLAALPKERIILVKPLNDG
jgi:hypothetical protein